MTTMGLRGVLAVALIVSTGLLTGMAAMPTGAAASRLDQDEAPAAAAPTPGLMDRIKLKACEISLAASRSDRHAARDQDQACQG